MSDQAVMLKEFAQRVADEFSPGMLEGADATLVVIVCDGEGWAYSLRGSLAAAQVGLDRVAEDVRRGEGFAPLRPVTA